jgi:hypothetical protein
MLANQDLPTPYADVKPRTPSCERSSHSRQRSIVSFEDQQKSLTKCRSQAQVVSFSFRPELNEYSLQLAQKRNQAYDTTSKELSKSPSHFELLYKADIEKRKLKLQMRKEQQVLKELEELKECTFQPRLLVASPSAGQLLRRKQLGNLYERNLVWQLNKERRLEKERKKESKDEVRECTFRPNIRRSEHTYYQVINRGGAQSAVGSRKKSIKQFMKRLEGVKIRK